ncbi:MAG: RNA polymerase sigma-70 factor [Odoribacteraceae bacterium]|jgi:RNA polymerase sigma-70 factor (ECF subfamily)|nr:RNA polymerase sigma-70 factor [Odoribacteraceae bacterium]
MAIDERAIIEQINRKNKQAFHDLFNDFFNSLVYFSTRYVGRKEVAEDIVQELFAGLWESNREYLSYNGFKTFLYTSVKHMSLDWLKHKKVEERYLSAKGTETDDEMDWKIMEEEIYRALLQAVGELPRRCREIFHLHLQGKKNEEIAASLGLSILTVKTQKKKASRYIRERMGKLYLLLLLLHVIEAA